MNDQKTFVAWHEKYVKQHTGYAPKNKDQWYETVGKKHLDIHKILNGPREIFFVEPDKKVSLPKSFNTIVNKLITKLPKYLDSYKITKNELKERYIQIGKRQFSTTKHILGYVKRQKIDDSRNEIKNIVSSMAQYFVKNAEGKTSVIITTHPYAFALLGNIVKSSFSCFAQGQMNSDKKFAFADHNQTFIYLIGQDIPLNFKTEAEILPHIKGRGMGIIDIENKTAFICNPCGIINEVQLRSILTPVFKQIFRTSKIYVNNAVITFTGGLNYNHGPQICFSAKQNRTLPKVNINLVTKYLNRKA